MSATEPIPEIYYPESDGKPMGETDVHRDWMIRILDLLKQRYRGQRVYVTSDLLVYYEEGEPLRFVVPDVFVALNCDPGQRRIFKIWEEGVVPNIVFEVTSRRTRRDDRQTKPHIYEQIGIPEVVLYDPTRDYLNPPLQMFRMENGAYQRLRPDGDGGIDSHELGVRLTLDSEGSLVMHDLNSGERLLTEAEAERIAREDAERKLASLRDEMKRRGPS